MGKEKVLITGGAGYIGTVLSGHLLEKGYKVTCLDDLRYGQHTPLLFAHNPDFEFVEGDARDSDLIGKLISKTDAAIPLAALVGMPICRKHPDEAQSINSDAVLMLNNQRSGDQKLIYPNTNSGYGAQTGEMHCDEETPLEPVSLYGKTKCEAERRLLEGDKSAITLRLATVFGVSPRMRTDLLVNDFVSQAMKNGSLVLFEKDFKRNYVHIRDVARAFEFCLEHYEDMKGLPYNLGLDDANLSKQELAEKIREHIPNLQILDAPLGKDPDKRNYIVSNKRISRAGFTTKFSLDDGIRELIKAYNVLFVNNPLGNA